MSAIIVLSDSEKAIFDAIQKAALNNETTPTLDTLRHAVPCGRDKAGQLVKSLEDKGLIRITGGGSNYRAYQITGTFHSTVKAERNVPEYFAGKASDLEEVNRRFVAALHKHHWQTRPLARQAR